jgi:hypothetical protein
MKSVLFILGVGLVAMLVFPFVGIWSLNTLFGLGIAYTWKTWLAWMALFLVLNLSISYKSKK